MVLSGVQGEIRSWWKGRGNDGKGEEEVKHNAAEQKKRILKSKQVILGV